MTVVPDQQTQLENRVLILAPTGRDGALLQEALQGAGIECDTCSSLEALIGEMNAGAGAAVIGEEALEETARWLARWIDRQPHWSDLPMLVLTRSASNPSPDVAALESLGNITLLERPIRIATLIGATRVALRVRTRQYQIRDHISERERNEQEMVDFFQNAPIGLHWVSADGIILRANQAELSMLGLTQEEYIGHHISEFHADPETFEEIWRRFVARQPLEDYEARLRCKDGSIRHVLMSTRVHWADGEFVQTRCFTRDITESRNARAAVLTSQERERARAEELGAVMATVPAAVWISHDTDCRLITGNRAGREILKMPEGANLSVTAPIDERPTHFRFLLEGAEVSPEELPMQRAARGTEVRNVEMEQVFDDGSRVHLYGSAAPLRGPAGEVTGSLGAFVDITRLKQAERDLREADRRKDEFLASLAHELRNPLAPIRNSLYILRLTPSGDPTSTRVCELMERQIDQMVRLVDDLLEVSRITRGKIELRKACIELSDVIASAIETSRPLIEAGRHDFTVELPAEPLCIDGDHVRLTQVFSNLLNNAAKYTNEGGSIRLEARREGDDVVVSLKDSGIGIRPEMLSHVFEMFAQGDRSAGMAQGGLGIGLTLVRTLVDMHGGSVQARSEGLDRGSEFVVRIPVGNGRARAHDQPERKSAPVRLPLRIVVLDDNRDSANSLAMLLRFLGAEALVFYDGPSTLHALKTFHPDVVLLDIGMPGMDGYEVARRIRAMPGLGDVKLIALTGWGHEEDRRRSRAAGFDYHLVKPVNIDAMQALLASVETDPKSSRRSKQPETKSPEA